MVPRQNQGFGGCDGKSLVPNKARIGVVVYSSHPCLRRHPPIFIHCRVSGRRHFSFCSRIQDANGPLRGLSGARAPSPTPSLADPNFQHCRDNIQGSLAGGPAEPHPQHRKLGIELLRNHVNYSLNSLN